MSLSKRKSPEHRRVFTNITDDEVSLKGTEELRLNLALVIPKHKEHSSEVTSKAWRNSYGLKSGHENIFETEVLKHK